MYRSQVIEMCHFGRLKYVIFEILTILPFSEGWNLSSFGDWNVHFREVECVILGNWNMSFSRYYNTSISGNWNLSFLEIKLAIFEKLKCSFFGGLNMTFTGNLNVASSGNKNIELSSFWKTESFIFFGRNHVHKKNWKSKPKTNCESKHTWGTTNVDRICHAMQPTS